MSDTPLSDKRIIILENGIEVVRAEFARALERETADLAAQLRRAKEACLKAREALSGVNF
jgi:hypothetical protein